MESLDKILNVLRDRVSWNTIRPFIKSHNLPIGQGWENTIKKIADFPSQSGSNEVLLKVPQAFTNLYTDHIIHSEKIIKSYKVDQSIISDITGIFSNIKIENHKFADYYPFKVPEDQLANEAEYPHLVQIQTVNNDFVLVFCTKRHFLVKDEVEKSSFPTDYSDYDQMFAYKKCVQQFFDVVVVNTKDNRIDLKIDNSKSLSIQDQKKCFREIKEEINKLLNKSTEYNIFSKPINFFSALSHLYYDKDEGRVCELGFVTDEGSIKHEKMRSKGDDLRSETYHSAGSSAVDHITPYRLAIRWECDYEGVLSTPELLLPGIRENASNAQLNEVIISKSIGIKDSNEVLNKLFRHIE